MKVSANTSDTADPPLPPEHPWEERFDTLSVLFACLGFALAIVTTFCLFSYARTAQRQNEQLWKNAEGFIVSTADTLLNHQGKPVDAQFARDISVAVSKYYEDSVKERSDALDSTTEARFFASVALLCKNQGIFGDAFSNYERSFKIFSALAPVPKSDSEAWVDAYNSLSGEADIRVLEGRFSEARQMYEESLKRRQQVVDSKIAGTLTDYAQGLINLGDVERETGEWEEALLNIDESIKKQKEAINLSETSPTALAEGTAVNEARHRLAIFQRTRAEVLAKSGNLSDAQTEIKEVIRAFQQLSAQDSNVSDPDMARALVTYGDMELESGDGPRAGAIYEKATQDWKSVTKASNSSLWAEAALVNVLLKEGSAYLFSATIAKDPDQLLRRAAARYEEALNKLNTFNGDANSFVLQDLGGKITARLAQLACFRVEVKRLMNQLSPDQNELRTTLMSLTRSEADYREWIRDQDFSFQAKVSLSDLLCMQGDVCRQLSMWKEAIKYYRESMSERKYLTHLVPENLERRLDFACVESKLAGALAEQAPASDDPATREEAISMSAHSVETYAANTRTVAVCRKYALGYVRAVCCDGVIKSKFGAPSDALGDLQAARKQIDQGTVLKTEDLEVWIESQRIDGILQRLAGANGNPH
jgi:tetratricopeptide (TPR) repeat protein